MQFLGVTCPTLPSNHNMAQCWLINIYCGRENWITFSCILLKFGMYAANKPLSDKFDNPNNGWIDSKESTYLFSCGYFHLVDVITWQVWYFTGNQLFSKNYSRKFSCSFFSSGRHLPLFNIDCYLHSLFWNRHLPLLMVAYISKFRCGRHLPLFDTGRHCLLFSDCLRFQLFYFDSVATTMSYVPFRCVCYFSLCTILLYSVVKYFTAYKAYTNDVLMLAKRRTIVSCKAKRQYLLTLQVNRYYKVRFESNKMPLKLIVYIIGGEWSQFIPHWNWSFLFIYFIIYWNTFI